MTYLSEALEVASKALGLTHLGGNHSPAFISSELVEPLRLGFEGVRRSIAVELDDLKRWQYFALGLTACGAVVLGSAFVLFLSGAIGWGAVNLIAGALLEVWPVLIFRRIDAARAALKDLLPDYRSLFAVIVALEAGGNDERLAKGLRDARLARSNEVSHEGGGPSPGTHLAPRIS